MDWKRNRTIQNTIDIVIQLVFGIFALPFLLLGIVIVKATMSFISNWFGQWTTTLVAGLGVGICIIGYKLFIKKFKNAQDKKTEESYLAYYFPPLVLFIIGITLLIIGNINWG